MGLDLVCGRYGTRMGSYTGVHRQRIGILRAEAMYRLTRGSSDEAALIRGAIVEKDGSIDYRYVRTRLRECLPTGVFAFVYHSDFDGEWTPDEASSILQDLVRLRPYLKEVPELVPYLDKDDRYHLEPILRASIETGVAIGFV